MGHVIEGRAEAETELAVLVFPEGDERLKVWVPKSLMRPGSEYEIGSEAQIEVPSWFAEKEGLV